MMKKLLIILLLLNSSPALSLPHKKKLPFIDSLLTKRQTQHDLLLYIDNNIAINVSQAIYWSFSLYIITHIIQKAEIIQHEINNVQGGITKAIGLISALSFNAYKVLNAERIMPIIIENES